MFVTINHMESVAVMDGADADLQGSLGWSPGSAIPIADSFDCFTLGVTGSSQDHRRAGVISS